jgi:hypothetical protein
MQSEFYNQPAVEWARRNLSQPVGIKVRFGSPWGRIFGYLLLFIAPLAFFLLGFAILIIGAFTTAGSFADDFREAARLFVWGGILLIPTGGMALVLFLFMRGTRPMFPKSLDARGVTALSGQNFLWEKLYYVDHVSKTINRGEFTNKKIKDNQLELIFENGKVIIPPLIQHREQIWNLVNSIPVQNRDDGEIRKTEPRATANAAQPSENSLTLDELMKMIESLPPPESKG